MGEYADVLDLEKEMSQMRGDVFYAVASQAVDDSFSLAPPLRLRRMQLPVRFFSQAIFVQKLNLGLFALFLQCLQLILIFPQYSPECVLVRQVP